MVPKLRIEVLGGFNIIVVLEGEQAESDGRPPMNAKYRLLAYLASYGGAVARDDVVTALFRENSEHPEVRMRQELKDLRDELSRITGTEEHNNPYLYLPKNSKGNVALSEYCEIDVAEFIQHDRSAYNAPSLQEKFALLQAAFDLYQGPLLRGYDALGRLQKKDPNEPVQEDVSSWVDLRRTELGKRFGEVARNLQALQETISSQPALLPVTDFSITRLNNLSQREVEPCLGRLEEKEEIKGFIATHALVKLIGAGGCGKTCLALEVARELERTKEFDVIWLLELAKSKDGDECIKRISKQFGLKGQESLEEILDIVLKELGQRRLLLVLDNCEHLVEVTVALIEGLHRGNIKILLTSQFDPYIEGKRYSVVPLPLPDIDSLPSAEELVATNAAVELFQNVAQMNQDDFVVDEQNKELVVRICHAVDGLPLAIRLVASHIRFCEPEDLLSELNALLLSEVEVFVDFDSRHSTMARCVNWAYRTLGEPEKMLLCRLSLFRGGMMRSRFGDVLGFEPLNPTSVLDSLNVLVSKSLVTFESTTKRYRQLEPVRRFAEQHLDRIGQRKEMQQRLEHWVDEITDGVHDGLNIGAGSADAVVQTAILEIPTIDSAAAIIEPADPNKAGVLRVSAMVLRFAEGRVFEGNRTLEALRKVVRILPNNADLRIWLYTGEAVFTFLQAKFDETAMAAALGLELALAQKDPPLDRIALAYCGLGISSSFLNKPEMLEQARLDIEEGARIAQSIIPEHAMCIAVSHMCRGAWLWQSKLHTEAREEYDLALDGFQNRAKNRLLATFTLLSLAHLNRKAGNIDAAVRQCLECMQTKNVRTKAGCLMGTCGIAVGMNSFDEAAIFYGAARRHYAEIGVKSIPPLQTDYAEDEAEIKQRCGDRYQVLYDVGASLTLPEANLIAQLFLKCYQEDTTAQFLLEVPEKNGLRQKLLGVTRKP